MVHPQKRTFAETFHHFGAPSFHGYDPLSRIVRSIIRRRLNRRNINRIHSKQVADINLFAGSLSEWATLGVRGMILMIQHRLAQHSCLIIYGQLCSTSVYTAQNLVDTCPTRDFLVKEMGFVFFYLLIFNVNFFSYLIFMYNCDCIIVAKQVETPSRDVSI